MIAAIIDRMIPRQVSYGHLPSVYALPFLVKYLSSRAGPERENSELGCV